MGKKEFDLTSLLSGVSSLDTGTGKKQIEYIDIERLHPDPNNFYKLDGIEELAANIELLGLQQPILVRKVDDGYMIVSGHRRTAAIRKLVEDGREDLRQVPCIVEAAASSPELQELRLIYANSDTRTMSSAELSRQAERVEMLLYQLKEQGIEFPGRMRDHVAEACKMSKSKLARLKVIREKLDKPFVKFYENGKLAETVAYALAQQPVEIQRAVYDYECTGRYRIEYLREHSVKSFAETYRSITEQECKKCGGTCSHAANLLAAINDGTYKPCQYRKCCDKCENLAKCKSACPHLAEKAAKLKADKREAARQEKLAREERERPDIEKIAAIWKRFEEARKQARLSLKGYKKAVDQYYSEGMDQEFREHAEGEKITLGMVLPYAYGICIGTVNTLTKAADALGCSIDYLLCRTDVPTVAETEHKAAPVPSVDTRPEWREGLPKKPGTYYIKIEVAGRDAVDLIAEYDKYMGGFYFPGSGEKVEGRCIGWWPVPAFEDEPDEEENYE